MEAQKALSVCLAKLMWLEFITHILEGLHCPGISGSLASSWTGTHHLFKAAIGKQTKPVTFSSNKNLFSWWEELDKKAFSLVSHMGPTPFSVAQSESPFFPKNVIWTKFLFNSEARKIKIELNVRNIIFTLTALSIADY